jgi:hypothetical protein
VARCYGVDFGRGYEPVLQVAEIMLTLVTVKAWPDADVAPDAELLDAELLDDGLVELLDEPAPPMRPVTIT